ncbi:MAG TPA: peptide ABC transporter substrate-binding protein [Verrucomicrobiae bacterium]|jgi:peptide/nickel transport system substrate-binding protein|nr:peptide ABC transporter substrate-binding protein [Verrucomicrobiae bacterium]
MRLGRAAVWILTAALLSGCVAGSRNVGVQAGTFRWADGEDIDNLNPMLSTETLVNDLSSFTMGYFFVFDDKGRTVPSLCLEVPTKANGLISANGKSLTFRLRRGVRWQDGAPFTSADVAFTVGLVLDPHTNVLTREGWDDIAAVKTPDDHTVVFRLKKPYAAFINRFFTPIGNPAILPKHLLAGRDINRAAYNGLPVGLGPFRYVRWARGGDVVMEASPYYWGAKPKLQRVVFEVIPDANTVATQLRTHELDAYIRVPTNLLEQVRTFAGVRLYGYDTNSYGHIDFNLGRPMLADVRVRAALARAIDVRLLWQKVDRESGFLACTPISHLNWAYDAHAPCLNYDLTKAAQLLDAAGWRLGSDGLRRKGGRAVRLQFAGNIGNPGLDARVAIVQAALSRLGVGLDYIKYPTDLLFASFPGGGIVATGRYDLTAYAWSLPPDPDISNLVACTSRPPAGQNYLRYCNPAVDAALQDALETYDRPRRRDDYVRVQEALARDVPFIVMSQRTDHIGAGDDVKGLRPGPTMVFWNPTQLSVGVR